MSNPGQPNPSTPEPVPQPPADPAGSAGGDPPPPSGGGEPEPQAPSTPDAGDGAPVSVGAGAPEAGEPKDPPDPNGAKGPQDWKAKKYDKVYAQLQEAKAALAAKEAAQPGPDGKPGLSEADVNARAAAIAAASEFNRHCNQIAATAAKAFPDFKTHIDNMRELITDDADRSAYNQMVRSAMELGDEEAGRVLYALGGNLDEANRIMQIQSPARQALELAKLAAARGEPEPSAAPKPITPVGPKGAVGEKIDPADPARADKLEKKEWFKRRQADIDKRRAAGERIW